MGGERIGHVDHWYVSHHLATLLKLTARVPTANVQVDDQYLGSSTDMAVDSSLTDAYIIRAWDAWAIECRRHGTPAIMQLSHPGRQCSICAGKHGPFTKNLAPSAVGLHMGPGMVPAVISKVAFGVRKALTETGIIPIIQEFARASSLARKQWFFWRGNPCLSWVPDRSIPV
jgi:2,4-dienoyl-CoA reductase-like NADH-dependent reductase (Old Yellow Enzyme family)